MTKYAVLFSYIGARYCGWQSQKRVSNPPEAQPGAQSVQEVIEAALTQITREAVRIVGSGRTDAGVHALGQVAHFTLTKKEWEPRVLRNALNGVLPASIRALSVLQASVDFHAQRSATHKQYSYYFQQGPCAVPHLAPFSWWIRKRLDVDAMNESVQALRGKHDFKPFQASGAKPGPTVREILEAEVVREPLPYPAQGFGTAGLEMVRFRVVGTGFLKQMVRGMAGTLLQIGEGRRNRASFREIIESGERSQVGPTAPARGLWLERVWYETLEFPGECD